MADFSTKSSSSNQTYISPFADPNNMTDRLAAFKNTSQRSPNSTPMNSKANNPPKNQKKTVSAAPKKGKSKTNNKVDVDTVSKAPSQPNVEVAATKQDLDFPTGDSYRVNTAGNSRELGDDTEEICTISLSAFDGSKVVSAYSRFFLQSVSESEQEKYQIVETFTSYYAFFFGKRPMVYRYSGILLNDSTHNWMNDFRFVYENFIRGTRAAEFGGVTQIAYDRRVVSGFILSLSINQDAMTNKGVPFSMDVLVTDHTTVGFSTDIRSFIQEKQTELTTLRLKAEEELARLNKNVDTEKNILKNAKLTGKEPASSIKKQNVKGSNPTSQKKSKAGFYSPSKKAIVPGNVSSGSIK